MILQYDWTIIVMNERLLSSGHIEGHIEAVFVAGFLVK